MDVLSFWDIIQTRVTWRDLLDIGLVAFIFYQLILLVRGTRAVSVILGLVLVLAVYIASEEAGLFTLHWLLANFLSSLFLVVIILFQQDIRRALSEVGAGSLWRRRDLKAESLDQIVVAATHMARRRIGALIVLERGVPLGDLVERGVDLSARLSKDLLVTIFFPNTPLHDGAVIIKGMQIKAAGCIMPLASGLKGHEYGTRHRAAVGVTEDTDAVAVVVSEERGAVSVAIRGKLTVDLDEIRLRRVLRKALEG